MSIVIITEYQNRICSFRVKQNRLLEVHCLEDSSKVGKLYIGKVKNIVKNLNACFVEIAEKELCFLPFKEACNPFCLNKSTEGPLVQGDELLVQVSKDAIKTKPATLTCNITITTDYFVFAAGNTKLGISSKLEQTSKDTIKKFLMEQEIIDSDGHIIQNNSVVPYGIIVRTDAYELFSQGTDLFMKELEHCRSQFLAIFESARHRTCFSSIQTPDNPYKRLLSRYNKTDYQEVVTDLNEAYTALQGHPIPVRLYCDTSYPLQKLYSLETKVNEASSKTVWLKSGANLVIEQTECLNTIDVNSAKKIKGDCSDESIWQINVEAAKEAALQIRLRNLSGIIIIDFVNMSNPEAEQQLIAYMKELVSKDAIPTNVIDITPLGLMEITRKKVNKSLAEQFRG